MKFIDNWLAKRDHKARSKARLKRSMEVRERYIATGVHPTHCIDGMPPKPNPLQVMVRKVMADERRGHEASVRIVKRRYPELVEKHGHEHW